MGNSISINSLNRYENIFYQNGNNESRRGTSDLPARLFFGLIQNCMEQNLARTMVDAQNKRHYSDVMLPIHLVLYHGSHDAEQIARARESVKALIRISATHAEGNPAEIAYDLIIRGLIGSMEGISSEQMAHASNEERENYIRAQAPTYQVVYEHARNALDMILEGDSI